MGLASEVQCALGQQTGPLLDSAVNLVAACVMLPSSAFPPAVYLRCLTAQGFAVGHTKSLLKPRIIHLSLDSSSWCLGLLQVAI